MHTLIRYAALALPLLLATACEEKNEPYYTASYPIVRIGAEVAVRMPDPLPAEYPTEEEIVAAVTAEVGAEAPVVAGGGYRLDFLEAYGGTLHATLSDRGPQLAGAFCKRPGEERIRLLFDDGEHYYDYTCTVGDYAEDNQLRTLLRVDLTEEYRLRHPEWTLESVVRCEYTSKPYR